MNITSDDDINELQRIENNVYKTDIIARQQTCTKLYTKSGNWSLK